MRLLVIIAQFEEGIPLILLLNIHSLLVRTIALSLIRGRHYRPVLRIMSNLKKFLLMS